MKEPLDIPLVEAPSRRLRHWISALAASRRIWGLADQLLISAANFLTMVLVGRGLGKTGFGQFSLVYNALLFANMLQSALVTQPHNVIGTTRRAAKDYRSYTLGSAGLQVALAGSQAVIALIAAAIGYCQGWAGLELLWALPAAIVAWQLQEFVRRVLYTEGRSAAAFVNDLLSYGGQAFVILIFWALDQRDGGALRPLLTGASALYALAATSAAGALLGLWQIGPSLRGGISWRAWGENWSFGKWLVGSEILTYASSLPMYMNLAGWLIGAGASGQLKAAQTLFGPARVLSFYLATVLPIRFSRCLAQGGDEALSRQLNSTALRVLPVLGACCLAAGLLAAPLLTLFGRDFAAQPSVMSLYAVTAFLSYVQMVLIAALTARRLTHLVFVGSVVGALVTVTCAPWLIGRFGIDGALLAMIFTGIAMTVTYLAGYLRRPRAAAPAMAPLAVAAEPCTSLEAA